MVGWGGGATRNWVCGARSLLSALQHIRQIQPGSPFKIIRIVRFTTLDVKVAQLPTKVRSAIIRRALLVLCW